VGKIAKDMTGTSRKKTTNAMETMSRQRRHFAVAIAMGGLAVGMVGLSYAAVPLYQLFCQVTGYGGTTQRAEQAPDAILDRKMIVRFDANVSRDMGWAFKPVQRSLEMKIGESMLAHYEAKNVSGTKVTGTATFNVTPVAAGQYFNKLECFCFTEQTLEPGARVDMPVTFFVDPEIVNDPEARNIQEITLSYTFFPVKEEPEVASTENSAPRPDGT